MNSPLNAKIQLAVITVQMADFLKEDLILNCKKNLAIADEIYI